MDVAEKLQKLLDRQAISDCLQRHARGQDRHDLELMASCYHPDAIDDHGSWVGPGKSFGEYANNEAHLGFVRHQHHLTTQSVEIEGDSAHAETYYVAILRAESGSVLLATGRYIDRFERRNGDWRISTRVVINESSLDVGAQNNEEQDRLFFPGAQDRTDLSYQRPLRPPRQSARQPHTAATGQSL
jgi:hypothetical protein